MVEFHVRANGKEILQEDLLKLELERSRHALMLLKKKLGAEGIRELLRETAAEEMVRAGYKVTKISEDGTYIPAPVELEVKGLHAQEFLQWWFRTGAMDPDRLNSAHPEHYMGIVRPDLSQEVIEVNGDLDTPIHFLIHVHPTPEGAPETPIYPIASYCTAATLDGEPLGGGVLHQFEDTEEGFRARLCNYFPPDVDEQVIHRQQMHLAVEWSNWVKMASEELA